MARVQQKCSRAATGSGISGTEGQLPVEENINCDSQEWRLNKHHGPFIILSRRQKEKVRCSLKVNVKVCELERNLFERESLENSIKFRWSKTEHNVIPSFGWRRIVYHQRTAIFSPRDFILIRHLLGIIHGRIPMIDVAVASTMHWAGTEDISQGTPKSDHRGQDGLKVTKDAWAENHIFTKALVFFWALGKPHISRGEVLIYSRQKCISVIGGFQCLSATASGDEAKPRKIIHWSGKSEDARRWK